LSVPLRQRLVHYATVSEASLRPPHGARQVTLTRLRPAPPATGAVPMDGKKLSRMLAFAAIAWVLGCIQPAGAQTRVTVAVSSGATNLPYWAPIHKRFFANHR